MGSAIFDLFYTILYSFGIFENLMRLYTCRWVVFISLFLLICLIVYRERSKKGFFTFIALFILWIYFFIIIPVQRNSELENSKKTGMELVEKINEYKTRNGGYPISIGPIYSSLPDKRGVEEKDIRYYSDMGGNYFTMVISNENWSWFSLRYRPRKKIFELSDSD